MGATPDRPRPKPTLTCHIQISIKLKQSRLKFNISFLILQLITGIWNAWVATRNDTCLTLNTATGMCYYGKLPSPPPKTPPAWNQQMVNVQFKFEDVIKTVPFSKNCEVLRPI